MPIVSVRVSDEIASYVKKEAKLRNKLQADMWRSLIERGIANHSGVQEQLNFVTKISVQSLCIVQRLTGAADESLIDLGRQDAKMILEKMGIL